MMFEYIRPIDPRPAHLEPELLPLMGSMSDAPDLAELVAHARGRTQEEPSLACPMPSQRFELPRFSGVSLADAILAAAPTRKREPLPIIASLPAEPRVLLGPGAMTMTLALVATLVFGVLVITH
jgi:hypothetical protein